MEELVKGDIVVIPSQFSDLSNSKKRPAFVAANLKGDDIILCQITSATRRDEYSIVLENNDFKEGSLHLTSLIRTNRIFTADKDLILYKVGSISKNKTKEVEKSLIKIFLQPGA